MWGGERRGGVVRVERWEVEGSECMSQEVARMYVELNEHDSYCTNYVNVAFALWDEVLDIYNAYNTCISHSVYKYGIPHAHTV